MNWGWKITATYLVFAGVMIWFVMRATDNRIDLVSKDYYEQELVYEKQITAQKNTVALSEKPTMDRVDSELVIQLPTNMIQLETSGVVHFYCPSDARNDSEMAFNSDSAGRQRISLTSLAGGHYLVQFHWSAGGKDYYLEQSIQI